MSDSTKSLFDAMYSAGKEVFDTLRKPAEKRKLIRKFGAAWDSLDIQESDAKEKIQNSLQDLKNYDLTAIIEQRQIIKQAQASKLEIQEHFLEMFGEEMVIKN